MPRACPVCGRTWDHDASFCGACGTLLDTTRNGAPQEGSPAAPRARTRGLRPGLVVVAILATAVVAALAVPRVDFPSLGADRVDDEVALPSDVDEPAPTTAASDAPVRCVGLQSPTACILWRVETDGPQPLGPRLPGLDVLVGSGPGGLQVREADTGELRWSRDDLPEMWPLGVVGEVVVARTRSLTQGFDAEDGSELWARTGLRPVGPPLQLDPPAVIMGRGDSDGTTALVALEPRDGDARWEWTPPWDGAVRSVTSTSPDALLASGAGRLARIDARTGTTVWTTETLDGAHLQPRPPGLVAAQTTVLGPDTASLVLHDAATGEVVHRVGSGGTVMSHLVVDGVLVLHRPAEQTIAGVALDSGRQVWRHDVQEGGSLAFPVDRAARDAVVVMEDGATRVRRLDPSTGKPLWQVDLPESPRGANSSAYLGQPMLVDDHVVVEDPSSVVTVLDLGTGDQRVRVDGGRELDVRSLDPLTLVREDEWFRIDVRDPTDTDQ